MMYTRYRVASDIVVGRRVLELGCGSGQGFGMLSRGARSVVGGDYSAALLRSAKHHYGNRVPLVRLSGDALPFPNDIFDVVLFFEASYYVPDMNQGFQEIRRVLAPSGQVLFVNANPERPDFVSSPHSVYYHTADEFRAELQQLDFDVRVEGAFRVDPPASGLTARGKNLATATARRVLEGLGLVPKTLRGRARIKRLLYGRMREVPAEIPEGFAEVQPRQVCPPGRVTEYKVIYVLAARRR